MKKTADSDIYRVDGDRRILLVAAGDPIPDDVDAWMNPAPKAASNAPKPKPTAKQVVEDTDPEDTDEE